jgi:hypothetical protein
VTRDCEKPQSEPYGDERVSRSYRDVATEAAPGHLDAAVLARAAEATRTRYARSLAWTRPLAWAATIVLCVTIVLELTRTPQQDGMTAPVETRPDAAATLRPAPVEETGAAMSAEQPAAPKSEAMRETAAAEDALLPQPAAPLDAGAFRPRDADMMKHARETAQRQSGANPEARALGVAAEAARSCDAKSVATPETWLDCIEGLEKSGLTAEAENERRLLEAAFPDFQAR